MWNPILVTRFLYLRSRLYVKSRLDCTWYNSFIHPFLPLKNVKTETDFFTFSPSFSFLLDAHVGALCVSQPTCGCGIIIIFFLPPHITVQGRRNRWERKTEAKNEGWSYHTYPCTRQNIYHVLHKKGRKKLVFFRPSVDLICKFHLARVKSHSFFQESSFARLIQSTFTAKWIENRHPNRKNNSCLKHPSYYSSFTRKIRKIFLFFLRPKTTHFFLLKLRIRAHEKCVFVVASDSSTARSNIFHECIFPLYVPPKNSTFIGSSRNINSLASYPQLLLTSFLP